MKINEAFKARKLQNEKKGWGFSRKQLKRWAAAHVQQCCFSLSRVDA